MKPETSRNRQKKFRINIFILGLTAFAFVIITFFLALSHRKIALLESKQQALEASKKAAAETRNYLSPAFYMTRTLANSAKVFKQNHLSRDILIDILHETIRYDSTFLAVWMMWEPQMYDGQDMHYAKHERYDEMGHYAITFYRQNEDIKIELNDPKDYQEDYYTEPKKLKKEIITEPYWWNYTGTPEIYFETSVISPILIDSVFHGVFAVDLDLHDLQNIQGQFSIYKTGYISLISHRGVIINHPDSFWINQLIWPLLSSENAPVKPDFSSGRTWFYSTRSAFTGEKVYRIFEPVWIGFTDTPWYIMVEIPRKEVLARSNFLLGLSAVVFLLGLALFSHLIFFSIRRNKYEKELFHAKRKAEESDGLKSAFLRNLSHEIRTPLNGIVGFADLLADEKFGSEKLKQYSSVIQRSSAQLINIVNSLINISLIEKGQIVKNPSTFLLLDFLNELHIEFSQRAEEKKLVFRLFFKLEDERFTLTTDRYKLRQILFHLLQNAIQYTDSGSVEWICSIEGKEIKILVKDTGSGIDPDQQKIIFDSFRTLEKRKSGLPGGLGIGLFIARTYAHFLDGSLNIEYSNPEGSCFCLRLPVSILR